MTKETRTIEQTIFKAEDGTIFFDELECAMYEQKNPYNEIIKNYLHLQNIMFFNQMIDGFWCENQEQIDLCCNWLITNYKNIGKRIIAIGKYLQPDYYFFIPHDRPVDNDGIGTYIMFPSSFLKNQWELFLAHLPTDIPIFTEDADNTSNVLE